MGRGGNLFILNRYCMYFCTAHRNTSNRLVKISHYLPLEWLDIEDVLCMSADICLINLVLLDFSDFCE